MKQASESSNTRISQLAAALPCALDDLAVLAVEGEDAVPFAQAQLASDVGSLADGHWHWTCLLSAQGRVLAFGPLLRIAPTRLLWIVPAGAAEALAAGLRRFVLRRRATLGVAPLAIAGGIGGTVSAQPQPGGGLAPEGDALRLDLGGLAGRVLRVGGPPAPAGGSSAAWRALDVLDGLPRIEGAAADAWTAHALGLQRVSAFSTRKGCYPGQEIVARTHFLGRNKREPRIGCWPAGGAVPGPGSRLLAADAGDDGEAMAEVVGASVAAETVHVLAVAREDAPGALRLAGAAAVPFHAPAGSGDDAAKMV